MKLSDFDFDLPEALIATRPAKPRSASRLLVADRLSITDAIARDLDGFLRPGDRLVLNDTRVIPARLSGLRHRRSDQGDTSAKIEVTLLEPGTDGQWQALLKPLRKVREGEVIDFDAGFQASVLSKAGGVANLAFNQHGAAFQAALARVGSMPLPPYIATRRGADAQDKTDYQTVWARHSGAVAAPTASLHFDQDLLTKLTEMGVDITYVTLHVGAGTFLPVKTDDVSAHQMHAEWGRVSQDAADEIRATQAAGHRVIPVGTTALRLIETAARDSGRIAPWVGETDIFIRPGFTFRVADALMTNFHLPKSTLMMLVSAFLGTERMREIYAHAIRERYRFFSYGDASLLIRGGETRQD